MAPLAAVAAAAAAAAAEVASPPPVEAGWSTFAGSHLSAELFVVSLRLLNILECADLNSFMSISGLCCVCCHVVCCRPSKFGRSEIYVLVLFGHRVSDWNFADWPTEPSS